MLDADGNLIAGSEQRYLPFGEVRGSKGNITQTDFGYTGQRDLDGTGLMDYRARFYDCSLGRFLQPDAIVPGAANPQAWNRYAYVYNNPLRYTDPSGHCVVGGHQMPDSSSACAWNEINNPITPTPAPTPAAPSTSAPTLSPSPAEIPSVSGTPHPTGSYSTSYNVYEYHYFAAPTPNIQAVTNLTGYYVPNENPTSLLDISGFTYIPPNWVKPVLKKITPLLAFDDQRVIGVSYLVTQKNTVFFDPKNNRYFTMMQSRDSKPGVAEVFQKFTLTLFGQNVESVTRLIGSGYVPLP